MEADMTRFSLVGRPAVTALGAAVVVLALGVAARADCADDLKKLTERRISQLNEINAMAAQSKKDKKPIDPAIFCAKAHNLSAAEDALIAYMTKNKDWCAVPDEVLGNLQESHKKSVEFGGRACVAAAKFKKMQEQQAAGGGAPQAPALPAGPL
jgi:hypothetical protein